MVFKIISGFPLNIEGVFSFSSVYATIPELSKVFLGYLASYRFLRLFNISTVNILEFGLPEIRTRLVEEDVKCCEKISWERLSTSLITACSVRKVSKFFSSCLLGVIGS